MNGKAMTATKRQRTCINCGAQEDKRSLLRIVRTTQGEVCFDATGRVAGRGAYVCSADCFEGAVKAKRLARALKTQVSAEDCKKIAGELACLGDSDKGLD